MPKKTSHAESRRLRKSVERRRVYANNLKVSARDILADDPDGERVTFADQLTTLADHELALARDELARAVDIDAALSRPGGDGFSSAASRAAAHRAMTAMTGRFAIDRMKDLLDALGIAPGGQGIAADLAAVEPVLGIDHGGCAPQVGARLRIAEETHARMTRTGA